MEFEMKLFAVAGNPVLHSRGPQLFNRLFRETGIDATYFRLSARNAEEVMAMARGMGLEGFNITLPFKVDILPYLDETEPPAREAGAVNCVYRRSGRLVGANTDHIGVVKALLANGVSPEGRRVVIFGAGGAARAAVYGLIKAGSAKVTLINRTLGRAKAISLGQAIDIRTYEDSEEPLKECDICISCIPAHGCLPDLGLLKDGCLYMAASYKDALPQGGRKGRGPLMIDGREWFICQALPGFRYFTGKDVPHNFLEKEVRDLVAAGPEWKPNIALVGFSGAGKTTAGNILAARRGYKFVDTDGLVEHGLGMSIPEIFRRRGEASFRDSEKEAILRVIPATRRTVFAIGGGAVVDDENIAVLRRHCLVIWIWASLGVSLDRIKAGSRPLLDHEDVEDRASRIMSARIPLYAKASDMALSSDRPSAKAVAERIHNEIDQAFGYQG